MIGLLYESDEWSDHKLAEEMQNCGLGVVMIDTRDPLMIEAALQCDLLISRVFASALYRGNECSHQFMTQLIERMQQVDSPPLLLNPALAHGFEIDKARAGDVLQSVGIQVPKIYAKGTPLELLKPGAFESWCESVSFPLIVKPNCGGRTTHTAILNNLSELKTFLATLPQIDFLIEEYIQPLNDFITRIEIVGGKVALVIKRSIGSSGLSSYHEGSSYSPYENCPGSLIKKAEMAALALGFVFGSFDIIEAEQGPYFIDANSVSNVSEDCTELLGIDLMATHAAVIAQIWSRIKERQYKHPWQ